MIGCSRGIYMTRHWDEKTLTRIGCWLKTSVAKWGARCSAVRWASLQRVNGSLQRPPYDSSAALNRRPGISPPKALVNPFVLPVHVQRCVPIVLNVVIADFSLFVFLISGGLGLPRRGVCNLELFPVQSYVYFAKYVYVWAASSNLMTSHFVRPSSTASQEPVQLFSGFAQLSFLYILILSRYIIYIMFPRSIICNVSPYFGKGYNHPRLSGSFRMINCKKLAVNDGSTNSYVNNNSFSSDKYCFSFQIWQREIILKNKFIS